MTEPRLQPDEAARRRHYREALLESMKAAEEARADRSVPFVTRALMWRTATTIAMRGGNIRIALSCLLRAIDEPELGLEAMSCIFRTSQEIRMRNALRGSGIFRIESFGFVPGTRLPYIQARGRRFERGYGMTFVSPFEIEIVGLERRFPKVGGIIL